MIRTIIIYAIVVSAALHCSNPVSEDTVTVTMDQLLGLWTADSSLELWHRYIDNSTVYSRNEIQYIDKSLLVNVLKDTIVIYQQSDLFGYYGVDRQSYSLVENKVFGRRFSIFDNYDKNYAVIENISETQLVFSNSKIEYNGNDSFKLVQKYYFSRHDGSIPVPVPLNTSELNGTTWRCAYNITSESQTVQDTKLADSVMKFAYDSFPFITVVNDTVNLYTVSPVFNTIEKTVFCNQITGKYLLEDNNFQQVYDVYNNRYSLYQTLEVINDSLQLRIGYIVNKQDTIEERVNTFYLTKTITNVPSVVQTFIIPDSAVTGKWTSDVIDQHTYIYDSDKLVKSDTSLDTRFQRYSIGMDSVWIEFYSSDWVLSGTSSYPYSLSNNTVTGDAVWNGRVKTAEVDSSWSTTINLNGGILIFISVSEWQKNSLYCRSIRKNYLYPTPLGFIDL